MPKKRKKAATSFLTLTTTKKNVATLRNKCLPKKYNAATFFLLLFSSFIKNILLIFGTNRIKLYLLLV